MSDEGIRGIVRDECRPLTGHIECQQQLKYSEPRTFVGAFDEEARPGHAHVAGVLIML